MQRKTKMSQNPEIWAPCDHSKTFFNLDLKHNSGPIRNTKSYVVIPLSNGLLFLRSFEVICQI